MHLCTALPKYLYFPFWRLADKSTPSENIDPKTHSIISNLVNIATLLAWKDETSSYHYPHIHIVHLPLLISWPHQEVGSSRHQTNKEYKQHTFVYQIQLHGSILWSCELSTLSYPYTSHSYCISVHKTDSSSYGDVYGTLMTFIIKLSMIIPIKSFTHNDSQISYFIIAYVLFQTLMIARLPSVTMVMLNTNNSRLWPLSNTLQEQNYFHYYSYVYAWFSKKFFHVRVFHGYPFCNEWNLPYLQ